MRGAGANIEVMREEAAAALCDIALDDTEMQDAIIGYKGVPPLLALCRSESPSAQQHAARCLWHLCAAADNQIKIVEAGGIEEFVNLVSLRAHRPPRAASQVKPSQELNSPPRPDLT